MTISKAKWKWEQNDNKILSKVFFRMILITAPAIFPKHAASSLQKSSTRKRNARNLYHIFRNMLLRSEMFEWTISYHILAWTGIYMAFVLNTGPRWNLLWYLCRHKGPDWVAEEVNPSQPRWERLLLSTCTYPRYGAPIVLSTDHQMCYNNMLYSSYFAILKKGQRIWAIIC